MVISLDPHTVGEVLGDARTLAQATDTQGRRGRPHPRGRGADRPGPPRSPRRPPRPRVVALEWLDPPFAAGHWTPQLIEYAGGEDVLGFAGENSEERTWEEVAAVAPDIVIVMPCGYDAEIAHREAEMHRDELAALGAGEVVAVDAAAYFSRPGPRLIDGLELLAHILHPELVPARTRPAGAGADGRALTAPARRVAVLFLHSSSGRYGADRQLALLVRRAGPDRYRAARRAARRASWPTPCAPPASR